MIDIAQYIRTVKDFPKPGIGFKDITTLLKQPECFKAVIEQFLAHYRDKDIDKVVGIEARGFIFAAPLALSLDVGFVPVRKPKKLPAQTMREEYKLEYGTDAVEIHVDAILPGERVLIMDDLLATGGTAAATARLVERVGGKVFGLGFLIELDYLSGRRLLAPHEVFTLIHVASEDD